MKKTEERCTYDPKINYNTPIMDEVMKEEGWNKFEDVPVFWRKNRNPDNNKKYKYFIIFPVDFYGHYGAYEKWVNDGLVDKKGLKNLVKNITTVTANTFSTKLGDVLPMLAADFYHHNLDWNRHYKWVDRYEKESGHSYKTGEKL